MDTYSELWIRYAKDGDELAFQQVYAQLRGAVVRTLQNNPATRNQAEDVAQSIFLELIKNKHKFNCEGEFTAWLFFYVHKRITDCGRRQQRDFKTFAEPAPGPDQETPTDRLAISARQEDRLILDEALAQLPSEQRAVFELREIQGLSIPEIVDRLDKASYQTVTMRLHRARVALRRILTRHQ